MALAGATRVLRRVGAVRGGGSDVFDDNAAARAIRGKFEVRRVGAREALDAAEARRMDGVLQNVDTLGEQLRREAAVLELKGYTVGRLAMNAMLASLADCGLYDDAVLLADEQRHAHPPNEETYAILIRAASYSDATHYAADLLWREAMLSGIKPTTSLHGAYLAFLSKSAAPERVVAAYDAFHAAGVKLQPAHHAMRLLACEGVAEVMELLPQMKVDMRLTATHMHAALKVARRAADPKGGQEVFDYFASIRVRSTEKSWTALLCIYADAGDLASLQATFAGMQAAHPQARTHIAHVVYMKAVRAAVREAAAAADDGARGAMAGLVAEQERVYDMTRESLGERLPQPLSVLLETYASAGAEYTERAAKALADGHPRGRPMPAPLREAVLACGLQLPDLPPRRDGLATWHERQTMTSLAADLDVGITVKDGTRGMGRRGRPRM